MPKNKFKIGDIVTLKSHPLAFQPNGEMDVYINQIPPFMCVKEVHIERNKKLYSPEASQSQIADDVKYLCTYFNQHRMEFEDKFVYQEMLLPLDKITFHNAKEKDDSHLTLIDETKDYDIADYEYGKRVFFKTFKLERRKKFKKFTKPATGASGATSAVTGNKASNSHFTHTSPAFVLSGIKLNDNKSIFSTKNGKVQRLTSNKLFKVYWYNAYNEKFTENYLPREFFIDDNRIYT
ncbi:MAG: hypothetical protein COA80_08620 [Leeuwenhoekiella sp.]|nr:MAG: hypothetical protein COA80_08620 [Leeuwenhoekiella sp.]